MKFTRKQFLTAFATGLIGTALRPRTLKAGAVEKEAAARFANQVGTSFKILAPGRMPIDLVLSRFEDKKASRGTTQFSLEFAAPDGATLTEGTYDVEHKRIGTFQMFVTPVGMDDLGQSLYRADFNLLDEPATRVVGPRP